MEECEFEDLIDWRGCDAVQFHVERLGGRATVGDSRLDAETVILNHEDGMSVDELYDHFHVDKNALRSVIRYFEAHRLKISA